MPLVTEKWSERTYTPATSARQVFLVGEVSDAATAISLCPVAENSTFSLDNRIRAGKPNTSSPDSPRVFLVEFNFAPPSSGTIGGGTAADLLKPPQYHPQISLSTEDVDLDINKNPIVSSARNSFSRPQKKRFPSVRYVYKRYESAFDGARAIAYTGTTNNDTFSMPGFGTVAAGQAFCEGITVAQAYDRTAQAILVQYAFELREDGFRTRILDEDTRGWSYPTTTATPGPFTALDGTPISRPIRLNGFGGPYDASIYKVGSTVAGSLAAPPAGAELETGPSSKAVFLRYRIYREMPFSGLTLTA